MEATFFGSAAEMRTWSEAYHAAAKGLRAAVSKTGAREPGVRYRTALDEGSRLGRIDGLIADSAAGQSIKPLRRRGGDDGGD